MHYIDVHKIFLFLGIFLMVSLLVILAILLDLWDGVHTARQLGERISSHRLRDTFTKMGEYWRFVIMGLLVDVFGFFFTFYLLPFMTMLFGVGLIAVEVKSMFEHSAKRKSASVHLKSVIADIIGCMGEQEAKAIIRTISKGIINTDINQNINNGNTEDTDRERAWENDSRQMQP